jgi:hypothetical protein
MATFIFLGCRASSMEVDTMKCRLVNFIFVLLLSLVAVTAMAEQCKPVHAQLGQMVFHDPGCVLDGVTYYWCAERPITGTLNGTYYFYSAPEFNGWDLEVPDGAMGASWWIAVSHEIAVFETQRGTLFTQESGVWHWGAEEGWATHANITGGTGHYEGATGWIASAGSWDVMPLVGKVCTP